MENILNEIREERARQNKKWGEQNHSVIEWQGILMEEVGEASKEAVDYHFKNGIVASPTDDTPAVANLQRGRLDRYRMELIQVAAVAVQMVESLDRNELKNKEVLNPAFFIFKNLMGEQFQFVLNKNKELQLMISEDNEMKPMFSLSKYEASELVRYISTLINTSGDDNS